MKYSIKGLNLKVILLYLIVCSGCSDNPEIIQDGIRPLVKLSTNDITYLEGTTQTTFGEVPWGYDSYQSDYVAKYEFTWESTDFIYIEEYITESDEFALEFLLYRHSLSSHGNIEENRDNPPVIGDVSYFNGIEFIRDNLIFIIHGQGDFQDQSTDIAKQVDEKVLRSKIFPLIDQVKPLINKIEVIPNPVKVGSIASVVFTANDPNNLDLTFHLRVNSTTGWEHISKDENGNYYFKSGNYSATDEFEVTLTLIATNEYGFCADSSIIINIEPN